MKTIRMILGIVSIVLFLLISLQSCAVGLGNTLAENGEVSGTAGLILSFVYLVSGIVAVAARKSIGGSIFSICLYLVGALIGFANSGSYSDLTIWSWLAVIFSVILFVTVIVQKKKQKLME